MPDFESNKKKHPALFIEGGDSVGKNELVRSIAKYILLAKPNQKVLLMNFPQYWFFGHDVRLVLRGYCDEMLKKSSSIENANIRARLFSMDRNLALLLAEPYLVADPSIFVLSDRGPLSSCVTTGYLWATDVISKREVVEEIIPKTFASADAGLLTYFDAQSLLCTVDGEFQLGKRKALDNNEAELPQKYAYEIYRMMGLTEITTKNKDKWKDRKSLAQEALRTMGYSEIADIEVEDDRFNEDQVLLNAYKAKQLIFIGPELFLKHFHAFGLVSPGLTKMIARWTELSLTSEAGSRKDRKELLDTLETKIAIALKKKTSAFEYLSTRRSPHARKSIAKLFEDYPLLFDILHKTSGKSMTTFFEGLLSAEQLRLLS